jgi:hypothetical protein
MLARLLRGLLGVVLILAGLALSPLPGPWTIPLVATGTALVLAQSTPGRRVLARVRLWARDRFGSERVREVERRMPRDVVSQDTQEMRLNLEEYEKRRKRRR